MRWLVDECVAARVVAWLRENGHDVIYVAETSAGIPDVEVMQAALDYDRLLLTEDKDFGELSFRHGQMAPGIVLMRVDREDDTTRQERLAAALDYFGNNLFGHYTVVEEKRLRSRPLKTR